MTRLADSRDPNGIGAFILRHRGFDKKGFSLDLRGGLIGVQVNDRDELEGGLGSWKRSQSEDRALDGDITQWMSWPANPDEPNYGNLTRRVGTAGWAQLWPSVTDYGKSTASGKGAG